VATRPTRSILVGIDTGGTFTDIVVLHPDGQVTIDKSPTTPKNFSQGVIDAVAIKASDGGPVFFSQERVGQGGRSFKAWKFRSMIPDAEKHVGAIQATEHDPRVTRMGRVMRATAMDELPQLWNIFVGDMSFVGPRALRPGEIEALGDGRLEALEDVPGYADRSRVRPGLTGVAQIYAPRDITRRNKFRYDRVYIGRQSLWLDVRLVALSFWITFRGKWEVRTSKI